VDGIQEIVKKVIEKDWDLGNSRWRYRNKYTGEVYDHKPAGLTDDLPTPRTIILTGIRNKKKYHIPVGSDKIFPDMDDLRGEYLAPGGERAWRTKKIIVKHIPGGGIERYLETDTEVEGDTKPNLETDTSDTLSAPEQAPEQAENRKKVLVDKRIVGLRRAREGNVYVHRHPTQLQDATTDRLRLEAIEAADRLLNPNAEKYHKPYTFAAFISTNHVFESRKMPGLPESIENDGIDLRDTLTNESMCGYDQELCYHRTNEGFESFKNAFNEWTEKVNAVTGDMPDDEEDIDDDNGRGVVGDSNEEGGIPPSQTKSPMKRGTLVKKRKKGKHPIRQSSNSKNHPVDLGNFHERMVSKKKHAVVALVYMSTYGVEVKRGTNKGTYFAFKDTEFHDISRIDNTAISLSQLVSLINKVKVQQKYIILDICHADKKKDGIFKSKFLYPGKSTFKELKKQLGVNCMIISSCSLSSKQFAASKSATYARNSIFGSHMLDAFRGYAASGIHSHISASQLFDFIFKTTEEDPLSSEVVSSWIKKNARNKLITPQKYSTFGKLENLTACCCSPVPPPAPSPPTIVKRDRFTVTVEWRNLKFSGLPLTKYELVYRYHTRCNNLWMPCATQSIIETNKFHICNLIPGVKFTTRVRAWNTGGWGPFSEPSEPISALTDGEVSANQKLMRAEKGGIRSITAVLQDFPNSVELQSQGLRLLNAYGSQGLYPYS
jgi:hypothetical protein